MTFFDDDPFENIVRDFFGGRPSKDPENKFISGEEEERKIDFIETDKKVFLIFELPGYDKEDIKVEISGINLEVSAQKKCSESVADYMTQKLDKKTKIIKILPSFLKKKKYLHTIKNGILEINFIK